MYILQKIDKILIYDRLTPEVNSMDDLSRHFKMIVVKREAVNLIDLFDQANTNNVLIDFLDTLGSRGQILKDKIKFLRNVLNEGEQLTTLSSKEAGEK